MTTIYDVLQRHGFEEENSDITSPKYAERKKGVREFSHPIISNGLVTVTEEIRYDPLRFEPTEFVYDHVHGKFKTDLTKKNVTAALDHFLHEYSDLTLFSEDTQRTDKIYRSIHEDKDRIQCLPEYLPRKIVYGKFKPDMHDDYRNQNYEKSKHVITIIR